LPGSARARRARAALHLIKKREALMTPLAGALQVAIEKIQVCKTCGYIDTQNPCTVCTDPGAIPRSSSWSPTSPISGAGTANATNGRYTCWAPPFAARRRRPGRI